MEKKTPLYENHVAWKGKIVPFAGYLLPVQYETGVIKEHMAVREDCGLFDVSHMGEVRLTGKDALVNIQHLVTNDCSKMVAGQAKYSPMCNEEGGVVDDLLVYKLEEESYLIVVNAANKEKDVNWMKAHITGEAELSDVSEEYAQLALQGPKAEQILEKICDKSKIPQKYYTFTNECVLTGGISCLVSRTGYTGEDGFELYCSPDSVGALWELLLKEGKEFGLIPCGLGARDTLRLEAAMPLYGHEMDDTISPLEAGLAFAVKLARQEDFIGKEALQKKGEPSVTRVGLEVTGRGIIREHCSIMADGKKIGESTSGTHCPYLGKAVAMALVQKEYAVLGTVVEADIRGRLVEAKVCSLPFYKRSLG